MKYDINNISSFMDCVNKYSLVLLRAKLVEYVDKNFFELLEAIGLNAKKFAFDYFFECGRARFREEKLFETIYNWAEKHALIKQNLDIIESASMKNAIKEELSDFLPKFSFNKMSHKFLLSVVVTKCGFLFSHEDLDAILAQNYNNKVEPTFKLIVIRCFWDDSSDEDDEEGFDISNDSDS
uniref:BACK domain-containing protein n=1 Tax=Panagrolaimus sp. PS1159 TaxID=55785 RepID=A0AC35GQK7_9BILA